MLIFDINHVSFPFVFFFCKQYYNKRMNVCVCVWCHKGNLSIIVKGLILYTTWSTFCIRLASTSVFAPKTREILTLR